MRRIWLLACPLLVAGGCVTDAPETVLVPDSPFATPAAVRTAAKPQIAASTSEAAKRVAFLGQRILDANPGIGARPAFRTLGLTHSEIFHVGTSQINITEGLVQRCKTEGQLAAILCSELGKMVSEREALASPTARTGQSEPPIDSPITAGDNGGTFGPADGTRLAELGRYEKERRKPSAKPLPPPDSQALATAYLVKAGFTAGDLAAADPLLKTPAGDHSVEKQLTGAEPIPTWGKAKQ
jgi:hypothetical protein